jgi:hypothetical protein
MTRVNTDGKFPGSVTTYQYPDINKSPVTFPTATLYKDFFIAYSDYLEALGVALATVADGGSWSAPSASKNIA